MKMNLKLLVVALVVAMFAGTANAQNPKRELRSVWYTTVSSMDWPKTIGVGDEIQAAQKQEMRDYLDKMKALNITSVCFQVRSESDAMYKSAYCPWSSYLTGERGLEPGWDPLAFAVEECHKRGMECWAWMNPYRWSRSGYHWNNTEHDKEMQRDGWLLSHDGKYITLNPALDKCRKRIVDVCKEVVVNYAVDGVLFDDYFYPNNIAQDSTAADYALYNVTSNGMTIGDWRRAHVNLMVKEVYDMIQSHRPDVRFGISPAGVAGKAETSGSRYRSLKPCDVKASDWQYATIFSDPLAWLEQKSIDFISPQIYWATWHETAPYSPLCEYWSNAANYFSRHFYSSHSIGSAEPRVKGKRPNRKGPDPKYFGEYVAQVEANRKYDKNNASGSIYFGARGLYGRNPGDAAVGDTLMKYCYNTLALNPVITWKKAPDLGQVENVTLKKGLLSWDKLEKGKSIVKYTIYAIPNKVTYADAMSTDGDGLDAKYLQAISYDNKYQLPKNKQKKHWYAICVYDGYGNEFAPVKVNYKEKK